MARVSEDAAAPAARWEERPPAEPIETASNLPPEARLDTVSTPSPATETASRPRRSRTRLALFILLPVALIAGGYWYVTGGQTMSTDDAYVEADKVGIATDVAGVVGEISVAENQHVDRGQILYRLDPRRYQFALDNAKANLAETGLGIAAMKEDYQRMLRDTDAQQSQVELDQMTHDRYATLVRSNTVPQATYDQARLTLQADKNKLDSLRQQAQVQLARLAGDPDIAVERHPQYLQAKAQVDEAQRQLDQTIVRAPFAGIVTNVPSIAVGKYLPASTTAFYLVATDHVWVASNPKETELTHVRPGEAVTVTVDTYPDAKWHGTVDSISPAAAQEFALLPAQNTSGNWVKVVQRIPMRVRLDTGDARLPPLRAGMSVVVNVDTGHRNGLPHFLTALFDRSEGGAS